jgi:synaptotagmin-4
MKESIGYHSQGSTLRHAGSGANFIGAGAIAVIVMGCLAAAIGSTSWLYKAYRKRKDRIEEGRRMSDAIRRSLMEEEGGTGMEGAIEGGLRKSWSLHSKSSASGEGLSRSSSRGGGTGTSPVGGQTKHLASPDKEEGGAIDTHLGELTFAVNYDNQKQVLLITVIKCTNLPARDVQLGTSDPYVKLQLLPEKRHRVKTRVLRKTTNPVYEETFTFFGLTVNQIKATSLHFVVLSFDRFSRDDIIGEVLCPLADMELNMKQEVTMSMEIKARQFKLTSQHRGELLVSLCHQPAANRLTVVVLKARNLPKMDVTGLAGDPYVKIYLLFNGQRVAKKKTHVKKRTLNPVYNESFAFEVPGHEDLRNLSVEFQLLDWDRVTKNEMIGRLELGLGKGSELADKHWSEVMNNPRKQIAEWHKLAA